MGMKYNRQTIDAGMFLDMMPDGTKLYQRPEMPMCRFKKNGVKYSVTDFRLLDPHGVRAFEICLSVMMNDPDATECRIEYSKDLDEDTIQRIKDIVMGFEYTAEKRGKHGYEFDSCVVSGVTTEETEEGTGVLTFHFGSNFGRYAYEYKQTHNDDVVSLFDLVVYAVGKGLDEFKQNEAVKWE